MALLQERYCIACMLAYQCVNMHVCSDLLFEQLYPQLVENMVAKGVFLESLESHIVADRLGHLPTPIMKDLLTHYQSSCMMDSLERCIVHLDITSLDIQQVRVDPFIQRFIWVEQCCPQNSCHFIACVFFKVVQVCWENQLYDAVIYVFNRGMNDYTTPMEVSAPYVLHT